MNQKIFNNMSLYTLANLFIDSYSDYKNRIINDKKLNSSVLNYVINYRKDGDLFFEMVNVMIKIRKIEN